MLKVDWHVGRPVFFTGLSRAHTFRTGSLGKSSYRISVFTPKYIAGIYTEIVTNKEVPSTCFICVIDPTS
jgi:hypothetical protein